MTKNRLIGLDILRALAIILVLMCHYSAPFYPFVSGMGERIFNYLNWVFSYFGVEFFFVLSGFLVGRIYLKITRQSSEHQQKKSLIVFIKRRWWRTLPNYYLFVLLNIALILLLGGKLNKDAVLKSLVFLQEIIPSGNGGFYGVSWSLAVEEWFYFLLPICFGIVISITKNRILSLRMSIISLFLLPTILKIVYCFTHPLYSDHELHFHFATLFRLDSIFAGVLFAWIWQNETWKSRLERNKKKLLYLGVISLNVSLLYGFIFLARPQQNSILYFLFTPLNSIAISSFIPFLMGLKTTAFAKKSVNSIQFLSKTSYSLYLSHVPIKQLCDYYFGSYVYGKSLAFSIVYVVMLVFFSLLVSYIIYQFFELNLLRYRDKVLQEL